MFLVEFYENLWRVLGLTLTNGDDEDSLVNTLLMKYRVDIHFLWYSNY